jgi:hypothetical protein
MRKNNPNRKIECMMVNKQTKSTQEINIEGIYKERENLRATE